MNIRREDAEHFQLRVSTEEQLLLRYIVTVMQADPDSLTYAGPGDPSAGAFDAFLWKNGMFTDIAQGTTDGGSSADAVGINEQGTAVGTYDATVLLHKLKVPGLGLFGYPHAYFSRNGVQTDLGTLAGQNGNYSSGFAINNAGQIVHAEASSERKLDSRQGRAGHVKEDIL